MIPQSVSKPGVMLEVFGEGVLLEGESGVGKSDLALALIDRGHQLIVDDQVEFIVQDGSLVAHCHEGLEGFLEIYGLGIVNVMHLYGPQAVKNHAKLKLVLSLQPGGDDGYDHLYPVPVSWRLQGVSITAWQLPFVSQRNMPLIIEAAVRLNLDRERGYDACSDFRARLAKLMKQGAA